jgi:hypothetical protein
LYQACQNKSPLFVYRARETAEEAAAKAAAITVDPQPLELESASEEKQED